MKQLFRTVLVVGDNPTEIIKKYSQNTKVEPYIFLKREDAGKHKEMRLKMLKASLNSDILSDNQIELTREVINIISEMTDLEYFIDVTADCEYYDDNTGDAYTTINPNAFYKNERSPQEVLEKSGEESGFCNPFKLYDDYISYSATKGEIDWSLNHLHNAHVYDIAWELIVNGKEPRTDAEKKIQENMKNRQGYFANFKDKNEYVSYCTSFWTYGIATNDEYQEVGKNNKEWISTFYDKYIKDLPDDTLLTIYEVQGL